MAEWVSWVVVIGEVKDIHSLCQFSDCLSIRTVYDTFSDRTHFLQSCFDVKVKRLYDVSEDNNALPWYIFLDDRVEDMVNGDPKL